MSADRATLALSFGSVAGEYDATRPSYPAAVLDHLAALVGELPVRVADIGAGTGKLTRLLLARGWPVTAVEPDAGMREVLAATATGVDVLPGTGEALPLADAAVTLVTYAQAWHWVDAGRAAVEAARVLEPGGILALVWNTYVPAPGDWFTAVEELTASGARTEAMDGYQVELPGLQMLPMARIPWVEQVTRDQLRRRAQTWSAVSTLGDTERTALLTELDRLLDTHPQTAGLDPLEIRHVTVVIAHRRP